MVGLLDGKVGWVVGWLGTSKYMNYSMWGVDAINDLLS